MSMNGHLAAAIQKGAGANIHAAVVERDQHIRLVILGSYEQVRHHYNQMACLIAGTAMQTLQVCLGHSRSAPSGAWFDQFHDNASVGDFRALFQMAAEPPCEATDRVGFLVFREEWPQGALEQVSGMKRTVKAMGDLGRLLFDGLNYHMVKVGSAEHLTTVKRVHEGINSATRAGYLPYQLDALQAFLETLKSARSLQLIHEISAAA